MPAPAPAAGPPVRAGGAAWTRIVTLVLAWGFLFSVVYLSWAKIRGIPGMRRVGVDIYLALATLAEDPRAAVLYLLGLTACPTGPSGGRVGTAPRRPAVGPWPHG